MQYASMNGDKPPSPAGCTRRASLVLLVLACALGVANLVVLLARDAPASQTCTLGDVDVACSVVCGRVCVGKGSACTSECVTACSKPPAAPPQPVGLSGFLALDAVQHAGITVANLSRATEFYTEVLGGVLVPNAGGDGWFGDSVEQLLFQVNILDAAAAGKTQEQAMIAQLQGDGVDRLAAVYVNFGAVQVELLDYRARNASVASRSHLPYRMPSTSPSIVPNAHVAFHVSEDKDLNEFVYQLETMAAARGFSNVRCNRVVKVSSERARQQLGKQLRFNSFAVPSGPFQGWHLAYCKGPEGEQLEFAQAMGAAGRDFDEAMVEYLKQRGGSL